MKRFIVGLMSVAFVTVGALAAPQIADKAASQAVGKTVVDKTLAIINGETILESEFNSLFLPMLEQYKQNVPVSSQTAQGETELKDNILDQKIAEVLLKQEVNKQKIKVSKKELQDAKREFPNESGLAVELKKRNMTMANFEKELSEQIAMRKLLKQSIVPKVKVPSETEAKDFYDKTIMKMKGTKTNLSPEEDALVSDFAEAIKRMTEEQVKFRQIFVSCPKDANETAVKAAQLKVATIKKELQKQTFADVATQYSENNPLSKTRNGNLEIAVKGYLDVAPSISEVVFSMKIGDYTKDPIKTDAGYHFIKVEEKRAKKDITFAGVKNEMVEFLCEANAREACIDYVNALKSKASIKINKTW